MPEQEQNMPLVIQRLGREQFLAATIKEMGGGEEAEKKATRYVARFKQYLMANGDLCDKASANIEAARNFLHKISAYAAVDAAPGKDLIISAYNSNSGRDPGGIGYQILETLPFQMRLIATVPNLFIGQPQVVIDGVDEFDCYYDTTTTHDMVVRYKPDLESETHPSPENIRAAFVNYKHNGSWGTVVVPKRDILNAKAHSKQKDNPKAPWTKHFGAMAKNTVIKRLLKILPLPEDTMLSKHLERTSKIEADEWENVDADGEIHPAPAAKENPPASAEAKKSPGRPRKAAQQPPREINTHDFEEEGDEKPQDNAEPPPAEKPQNKQKAQPPQQANYDDGSF